jgi:hypothetical protein
MADVDKDARLRMQLKLASFRAPLPRFNIGDAIEITVRPVPLALQSLMHGVILMCAVR